LRIFDDGLVLRRLLVNIQIERGMCSAVVMLMVTE
jgi:hypothetical protein